MSIEVVVPTAAWALACLAYYVAVRWHRAKLPANEVPVDETANTSTHSPDWRKYAEKSADECIASYESTSNRTQTTLRNHVFLVVLAIAAMSGRGTEGFEILGTVVPRWVALLAVSIGLLSGWFKLGWLFVGLVRLRRRATKLLPLLEDPLGIQPTAPASRFEQLTPSAATPAWFAISLSEWRESSAPYADIMVLLHCLLFGLAHALTTVAAVAMVLLTVPTRWTTLWISVACIVIVGLYWGTHYVFRFQAGVHRHGVTHLWVLAAAMAFTAVFGMLFI